MILPPVRPETCLSDLALDRITIGEVSESETVSAHLVSCAGCRGRLDELRREHAAFAETEFVAGLAASARKRSLPTRRAGALAALTTTLVAAAAVLFFLPRPARTPRVRYKGGFQLSLVARRADGHVERVTQGATLAPDDAIRFRVASDRNTWLVIVGVDTAGQVTPYVPQDGSALALPATHDRILDGSIILDDTEGSERVVALSCPKPLPVARAVEAGRRALKRAGGDPRRVGDFGLDCAQTSALFVKRR
jgi:hypothetical protein